MPVIKSDPYSKLALLRQKRRKHHLWTDRQWRDLEDQAADDQRAGFKVRHGEYPISPACVALICKFNKTLRVKDKDESYSEDLDGA